MSKKSKSSAYKITFLIIGLVLLLYTVSLIIPLFWAILTSLKDRNEFILNGPMALPTQWKFENYLNAWSVFRVQVKDGLVNRFVYLDEMFINSITYSVGMAALATFAPCLTGYLCAKFPCRFSRFIYLLVVVLMIIPVIGNMPSMLLVMKTLGIYDTYFGMACIKFTFAGTYFIIFFSTFKGLSDGYAEAARIDGASETTIMFKIMFPLVKTTIAALFLLRLIAMWNDYMTSMVYYPSHPTAALGLMLYYQTASVSSVPDKLAGSIIVIIPLFIVFIIFRKNLMGNLTMGGLKG